MLKKGPQKSAEKGGTESANKGSMTLKSAQKSAKKSVVAIKSAQKSTKKSKQKPQKSA